MSEKKIRIKITDIPEEGLELSFEETPQELDLVYPDIAFEGGIQTQVRLTLIEETVATQGTVQAGLILQCGRCIKPFSYPVHLRYKADFNPKRAGKEVEDADLYFYTGRALDLREFLREQILLALPMIPVCRADCRGLCPQCGQDRNLKDCGCVVKPVL